MGIEEIVKSINSLKVKLENKESKIQTLQKENNLLLADNENLSACLEESESRLKKTLVAIVKNAKDGMRPAIKGK